MNRVGKQKQFGFTIVELLIVIVVIAILAAISIVAYTGIQNRANDSAIQQDLATFSKKIEIEKVDKGGQYPDNASLTNLGFKASKQAYDTSYFNLYYCHNTDRTRYSLTAKSKSGMRYYVTSEGKGNIGSGAVNWSITCGGTAPPTSLNHTSNGGSAQGNAGYVNSTSTWSSWTE